ENIAQNTFFVVYALSQIWGCSSAGCFDYPFSRTVSQSIDVYISCQGWQTGTGNLVATTVVSQAYMDADHSLLDDTLFGIPWNNLIPSYVDSKIRSSLAKFGSPTAPKVLSKTNPDGTVDPMECNRLGVVAFTDGLSAKYEAINYDYVVPRFTVAPGLAVSTIT